MYAVEVDLCLNDNGIKALYDEVLDHRGPYFVEIYEILPIADILNSRRG